MEDDEPEHPHLKEGQDIALALFQKSLSLPEIVAKVNQDPKLTARLLEELIEGNLVSFQDEGTTRNFFLSERGESQVEYLRFLRIEDLEEDNIEVDEDSYNPLYYFILEQLEHTSEHSTFALFHAYGDAPVADEDPVKTWLSHIYILEDRDYIVLVDMGEEQDEHYITDRGRDLLAKLRADPRDFKHHAKKERKNKEK